MWHYVSHKEEPMPENRHFMCYVCYATDITRANGGKVSYRDVDATRLIHVTKVWCPPSNLNRSTTPVSIYHDVMSSDCDTSSMGLCDTCTIDDYIHILNER